MSSSHNNNSATLSKESEVSLASTPDSCVETCRVTVRGDALSVPTDHQASQLQVEAGNRSAISRGRIAVRGSAWTITEHFAVQLLRMLGTLILARNFLPPETFGVVGLVSVFISGLTMFSELGIVVNIVQHPRGDDPKFLNTAFSVQAARGVLIWIAAAAAAFPLAKFYKQPELLPLLLVVASSEIIRGLTSTAAWTLKRHVKLGRLALLAIVAEATAFVIGILWATASPSAWALVARTLAAAAIYALGSHFIAGRAVAFRWDQSAAADILKFGKWISLATAAHFLASQGERLFLAKFISVAELGCFSLAVAIATAPAAGIGQLVNQVFLPMISASVRTGREETTRDFLKARLIFLALAVIAGFGFLALAKPFVSLVLNPEYEMTGWMLQILGLRVALDLFASPASSLILACGQSQYAAAGNTTRLVLMVGGLVFAFSAFGIREAVLSLVVAQALSYFPIIAALNRLYPELGKAEVRRYGLFLLVFAGATVLWLGR